MKQEFEKQDELKRSALRATVALLNVPDSSKYYVLEVYYNIIDLRRGNSKSKLSHQSELNIHSTEVRVHLILNCDLSSLRTLSHCITTIFFCGNQVN